MEPKKPNPNARIPVLDFSEGTEMVSDFSREAQRHLISARNSLLILESVPSDREAIENIFKTFHTIKGLSDFLRLQDIHALTMAAELMMDMMRKNSLTFEGLPGRLVVQAIESLQKLLELLDEQLTNNGVLKSPYHDTSDLVTAIQEITSKKTVPPSNPSAVTKVLPTISFEPDLSVCLTLEEKLKAAAQDVVVDKKLLKELIREFQITSKELREVQSKLHERQRELIKERELAIKLTQQAQSEARAKSEYLANMSHEIRTLINAILGFTELLRESALNSKQKEHLNTIILSGRMLLEIVNDILDYSKVEAGKLQLENIEFNLDHIVEDVFTIIRTRLSGKPINLYFSVDENLPRQLMGDPTRLKQVFINLLENAIKFTEKGEIGLSVRPAAAKRADAQAAITFAVKDTGIGIPSDRKQAIFESFTQADASTTRLYGGTGLGLTLCKNFVEKMGGKIQVESDLGKGSEFIFTIPFHLGPTLHKKDEHAPAVAALQKKETLIVDGHERSAAILTSLCQGLGLTTLPTAQNAKQATELLLQYKDEKKTLPHIMFIDVFPAEKDGFMLAYKIKQQDRYRSIKLIAVSSDVRVDGSEDFRQAGFDDFLPRPFIRKELTTVLLRVLGAEAKEQRVLSKDAIQKISCEGIRVLVVEDSLPNQELLKVHFETLGCVCDYASNGQEAIEKIKTASYDICFMDLQMPIMGGVEATRIIRSELKNKMPIIALTAAEAEEEKEKCLNVGMNDYLPKPFDLGQLKEKIICSVKM
ncbi:MAG: response regulator [Candidatus Omnitrophota bacterium]|nr:response regulator [Candidatus Omnitrophota bacterium]MDZ4242283.1 response regulator [Candidatus Omnitrophota bacterium]